MSNAQIQAPWRSPDCLKNSVALQANFPGVFEAMSDIDALGHRLLKRAADDARITNMDALVGLSMLRRSVTHFIGLRHLLEASAVEPAKLVSRAQFETLLAFRYLVHGGQRKVSLYTPSSSRAREARARYFYVAAERRKIYGSHGALDGRWGVRVRRESRGPMKEEISNDIARLQRLFPTQTKAFGPYRCHIPGKKPQYFDQAEWYSFGFRGARKVNSVRALAGRFGWLRDYEFLYDAFSGLMHPRGVTHDGAIANGRLEIFTPYLAEAFPILSTFGCRWQLLIFAFAVKAYHPPSLGDAQAVGQKVSGLLAEVQGGLPAGWS